MSKLEKYWVRKDQLERRISISKPQARILNSLELLNNYYERLIYVNNQNFIHYRNDLDHY